MGALKYELEALEQDKPVLKSDLEAFFLNRIRPCLLHERSYAIKQTRIGLYNFMPC